MPLDATDVTDVVNVAGATDLAPDVVAESAMPRMSPTGFTRPPDCTPPVSRVSYCRRWRHGFRRGYSVADGVTVCRVLALMMSTADAHLCCRVTYVVMPRMSLDAARPSGRVNGLPFQ